jgi:Ser-tRNA(Ala) deacylase AlaX
MDIDRLVEGIEPTVKSYWDFPERKKQKGTVLNVACDGDFCYVVLNQTIFNPETDEQEGDSGWIRGKKGKLQVKNTLIRDGVIIHEGKMQGKFEINEQVDGEVFWQSREKHVRMHTLGHIVRASILELKPDAQITKYRMSTPGFVHIKGGLNESEVEKIKKITYEKILEGIVVVKFMGSKDFGDHSKSITTAHSSGTIRVVSVDGELMTCGGIIHDPVQDLGVKIVGMRGEKLIFDLE